MDLFKKAADKLLVWVLNLVLATNVIMIFVVIYWGTYPYKPIEAIEPFPVMQQTYQRGQSIMYKADYCFNGNYPIEIDRRLVGSVTYPFPLVVNHSEKGCYSEVFNTPPLPLELEPGTYELRLRGIYQVNPIREIHVQYVTEAFEVI